MVLSSLRICDFEKATCFLLISYSIIKKTLYIETLTCYVFLFEDVERYGKQTCYFVKSPRNCTMLKCMLILAMRFILPVFG